MTVKIPVRGSDRPALVDDDMAHFAGLGWRLSKKGYVIRYSSKKITMHLAVMGLPPAGFVIDHMSRDKLDCRRQNLRVISTTVSQQNCGPRMRNTTGYRGVFFDKSRGKYVAHVRLNGHNHNLGRFEFPEQAAEVAKEFRIKHMPFSIE